MGFRGKKINGNEFKSSIDIMKEELKKERKRTIYVPTGLGKGRII